VKVKEKQLSAKGWNKKAIPFNKSQPGQIPIVYKNDKGLKEQGYIALTDIELNVDGQNISVGKLLSNMLDMINENKKTIAKCLSFEKEITQLKQRIRDIEELQLLRAEMEANNEEDII